jgi:hypothetical protein
METLTLNNARTVNTLLETFFDDTPINVLQDTLNDMAKVYSEFRVRQSSLSDNRFLIENSIYQVGIINELLSSLSDVHSDNETAVNCLRTLQNQQN